MEKAECTYFNGEGPFSSINKFTTRIQMAKACVLLGIPFESDEFTEGVLNADRIISEGDFFEKNENTA